MPGWPTLDELLAMKAGLRELPGWSVRVEMLALDRSLRVFTGNAKELLRFLGEQQEPANAFQLWALSNRDGFERFLDEVDRLLHNFVGAAMSLKDHGTRVRRKLLQDDAVDTRSDEYQARVDRDFTHAPLAQFVQQLRNYTVHERLPVATGQLSGVPGVSFESRIVLHPSELLKWPKWNSLARRYMETAGDDIAIEDVVKEYTAVVVAFNEWFRGALAARNRPQIEALEQGEAEIARLWRQAFGPPGFGPPDDEPAL